MGAEQAGIGEFGLVLRQVNVAEQRFNKGVGRGKPQPAPGIKDRLVAMVEEQGQQSQAAQISLNEVLCPGWPVVIALLRDASYQIPARTASARILRSQPNSRPSLRRH